MHQHDGDGSLQGVIGRYKSYPLVGRRKLADLMAGVVHHPHWLGTFESPVNWNRGRLWFTLRLVRIIVRPNCLGCRRTHLRESDGAIYPCTLEIWNCREAVFSQVSSNFCYDVLPSSFRAVPEQKLSDGDGGDDLPSLEVF